MIPVGYKIGLKVKIPMNRIKAPLNIMYKISSGIYSKIFVIVWDRISSKNFLIIKEYWREE